MMWTNAEVVRVRANDVRRKRLLLFLVCQVTAQSWEGLCSDCYYVLMKMIWDVAKQRVVKPLQIVAGC